MGLRFVRLFGDVPPGDFEVDNDVRTFIAKR